MLHKSLLTEKGRSFQVGGFQIAARTACFDIRKPVSIPAPMMAFEALPSGTPDFAFTMDLSASVQRGMLLHRAENFMRNAVYESGPNAWVWTVFQEDDREEIEMQIAKDFSRVLVTKNTAPAGDLMFELGLVFSYAMLSRDACVLHGVLMEWEGRGILLLARSGMGKTTHARMWRDTENALILNGDRCLCRNIDAQWIGFGMPWCGTSGEYINRKVPITDIVFLDRGLRNTVSPMPVFDGTMRLLESIKAPTWEPTLYTRAMDRCEQIAQCIPMWHLLCTPDVEALQVLKEALCR